MTAHSRWQRPRVIPVLLIQGLGVVKTTKFSDPRYIGDPLNSVKLFNDCEVDELMILDISENLTEPKFDLISQICAEAFMPVSYGGGLREYHQVEKLFSMGVEKICVNTSAFQESDLIERASAQYGAQSVLACLDVKKNFWGKREVVFSRGHNKSPLKPEEAAQKLVERGVGEIILQSVDLDGSMKGYDLELIQSVASQVQVPVVALGGAGQLSDLASAIQAGASAAAAGSLFVYHGKLKGILINYPEDRELYSLFEPFRPREKNL